jgi:hypothetical protein
MTKSDAPDLVDILNSDDHPLTPCTAVAAIITVAGQGYLMQLRDPIPGIFYPGHWGLFGGGAEDGEGEIATLKRELEEEPMTRFDFSPCGFSLIFSLAVLLTAFFIHWRLSPRPWQSCT